MHTPQPRPPLGARSTALISAAVVLICLVLDLLELPVESPPIAGIGVLLLAGAGLAWVGGRLAAALVGASGAIFLGVLVSAGVHRAFGQTPWRMYAIEFLPMLAVTVAVVLAAVAAGWLAVWLVRRSEVPAPRPRGLALALLAALGAAGGGTLIAEMVQAVVPTNAQEVRVSVVDGALRVEPGTFSSGAPTYLLVQVDAELIYLPVGSDAEAARRLGGDLVDRDGVAGYIAPRDLANHLRRSHFQPGRYVLVAVEPQEPMDDSTILILNPDDPPPDTRTMRTDIAPTEFIVTE